MNDVIEQMLAAMNRQDVEAAAALMHEDYRSEQPLHPDRAFVGRAQMRANWTAMFAGVPDFRAQVRNSAQSGRTVWTEWDWSGTRTDGGPFHLAGVTLFDIEDGQVVAGRLFMEEVDEDGGGIAEAVRTLSGQEPQGP